LRLRDIGPGDEVVAPSHTAVATVSAIQRAGATPVLADVEPDYYTMDPVSLKSRITGRTKAVIPVHIYGQPADMPGILEVANSYGLAVIEDCAQAHGARLDGTRVGRFGDAGTFSFYPTKNLGAIGDGGALVSNDLTSVQTARLVREYGWANEMNSQIPGINSRLDELQAAILNVKLPYLDADNARRVAVADRYDAAFSDLPLTLPKRRQGAEHVFHLYVVRLEDRDRLRTWLRERDIVAGIHYRWAVHHQDAFRGRIAGWNDLPVTDQIVPEILSLPIYPELSQADQDRVIQDVRKFFGK